MLAADGPAPNPQSMLNSLGSMVTAASSVGNAAAALNSAANGGTGNILQSVGSTAQALAVSLPVSALFLGRQRALCCELPGLPGKPHVQWSEVVRKLPV